MNRTSQTGSVLVICLGVLVVMSLMATAFLSMVTLNRDTGANAKFAGMARLAVSSAQAHTIAELYKLSGSTTGGSAPFSVFMDDSSVDDLWSHAGVSSIKTSTTDNAALINTNKSKWFEIPAYYARGDLTDRSDTYDVDSHPLVCRYAVSLVDLEGALFLNDSTAGYVNYAAKPVGDMLDCMKSTAAFPTTTALYTTMVAPTDFDALFSASPKAYFSWNHIKSQCAAFDTRSLMAVTPFGQKDHSNLDSPHPYRLNLNTMPKVFFRPILQRACDQLLLGIVEPAVTQAEVDSFVEASVAAVQALFDASPRAIVETNAGSILDTIHGNGTVSTAVSDIMTVSGRDATEQQNINSAINNVFTSILANVAADKEWYAGAGTTSGTASTYAGSLFVGTSEFWRVSVRGQFYDKAADSVISEANMEFVYFSDVSETTAANRTMQILYQRWIQE